MEPKKEKEIRFVEYGSRAGDLFSAIIDEVFIACPIDLQPTMIWKYGYEGTYRIRDAQERRNRYRALKRLEEKRLLTVKKIADQYHIALTDEGMQQAFWLKAHAVGFLEEGIVSMVIFDIPETHRNIRKRIRTFLSDLGFLPIQQSVWVSPYDISNELIDLFNSVKVSRWVRVYNAKEVRAK